MRAGAQILQFLASKDINRHQMHFRMSVFAGLGCTHFHNLARAVFDHHEPVLAQGGALHGICGGGAGIGGFEGVLMLYRERSLLALGLGW